MIGEMRGDPLRNLKEIESKSGWKLLNGQKSTGDQEKKILAPQLPLIMSSIGWLLAMYISTDNSPKDPSPIPRLFLVLAAFGKCRGIQIQNQGNF